MKKIILIVVFLIVLLFVWLLYSADTVHETKRAISITNYTLL